jgi:hypothetical protein
MARISLDRALTSRPQRYSSHREVPYGHWPGCLTKRAGAILERRSPRNGAELGGKGEHVIWNRAIGNMELNRSQTKARLQGNPQRGTGEQRLVSQAAWRGALIQRKD